MNGGFVAMISSRPTLRRHAILLGNANYYGSTPLNNPVRDVHTIAAQLQGLDFSVLRLTDLDRKSTESHLKNYFSAVGGCNEAILFYYSGHGLQLAGENYIVPIDFDRYSQAPVADLVPVQWVLDQMASCANYKLVFLDACRDNGGLYPVNSMSISRGQFSPEATAPLNFDSETQTVAASRGLSRSSLESIGRTLIAFAADPGGVASDGPPNGMSPFSHGMSRHIGTRGLDIFDMFQRVARDVHKATKSEQIPWSNSNFTDRFEFHQTSNRPIRILATLGVASGFASALLAFDLFDGIAPGSRELVNVRYEPISLVTSLLFGSVLGLGTWWYSDRHAWWRPLATCLIFVLIAVLGRWWFAPYGELACNSKMFNELTLDVLVGSAKSPELREIILIAILSAGLAGAASVASGAHSARTLLRSVRIFAGAICGVSAAFLFFLFIRAALIELGDLPLDSSLAMYAEAFGIMIGFGAWHGAMAYNVGWAYAQPVHKYDAV